MRLDIHLHDHRLNATLEALMATLDEVLVLVTDENTKLDSVIALVDGLKAQLDEALAGTTLPPAVQAKVDAIFAAATTNAGKIVDALDTTNTPPAP
jgi:hypothetical protein